MPPFPRCRIAYLSSAWFCVFTGLFCPICNIWDEVGLLFLFRKVRIGKFRSFRYQAVRPEMRWCKIMRSPRWSFIMIPIANHVGAFSDPTERQSFYMVAKNTRGCCGCLCPQWQSSKKRFCDTPILDICLCLPPVEEIMLIQLGWRDEVILQVSSNTINHEHRLERNLAVSLALWPGRRKIYKKVLNFSDEPDRHSEQDYVRRLGSYSSWQLANNRKERRLHLQVQFEIEVLIPDQ